MFSRHFLCKIIPQNLNACLRQETKLRTASKHFKLFSSSKGIEQKQPQYEYDPSTDTFRPKHQQSFTFNNQQVQSKRSPLQSFFRKWTRTVFLITGGIVWGAIIFVGLFVDVKESNDFNFPAHHDLEEEVRSLVFYNLAHGKNDLARLISLHEKKEGDMEDIHQSMHVKHEVFLNAIEQVQNDERVIAALGGHPVQVCGFRVAHKIGELIEDFQKIALDYKSGKTENLLNFEIEERDEKILSNTWSAECVLEGKECLGLLQLDFKRKNEQSPWILNNSSFKKLSNSNQFIKLY